MLRMMTDSKWLLLCCGVLVSSCAHQQTALKVPHAGSYEFVDLGYDRSVNPPLRIYRTHGKVIYSSFETFDPSFYSVYLTEHMEIRKGETVLDIGTGSGIQAIHAADKASYILATDISNSALKDVEFNAKKHGVEKKIETRISDLFDAIRADEKFDVILVSIPYPQAVDDKFHWGLYERFFAHAEAHLKPNGRIYFLSGLLENLPGVRELVIKHNLAIMNMDMVTDVRNEREMMVYRIEHIPEELKPRRPAQNLAGG